MSIRLQRTVSAIAIILKAEENSVFDNSAATSSFAVLFRTNKRKYYFYRCWIINGAVKLVHQVKKVTTSEIRSYISHNRKIIYDVIPLTYVYDDTDILRYVNCCDMFLSIFPSLSFERGHTEIMQRQSCKGIHELISNNKNPFEIINTVKNVVCSQATLEPRLMTLTNEIYKKFRRKRV